MELTWIMMFIASIILMIVVFLIYFSIRASQHYHDLSSNFGRILGGSIVAGGGAGIILGFLLWCVLPTYHYITSQSASDGYYTRYVMDENLSNEYGRKYLANLTESDCFLAAMTYGNAELKEDESPIIPIQAGYIVEIEYDIDGWFKPFPEQVSSENKGAIKWYVLSESMLISEFKKIGVDLTE